MPGLVQVDRLCDCLHEKWTTRNKKHEIEESKSRPSERTNNMHKDRGQLLHEQEVRNQLVIDKQRELYEKTVVDTKKELLDTKAKCKAYQSKQSNLYKKEIAEQKKIIETIRIEIESVKKKECETLFELEDQESIHVAEKTRLVDDYKKMVVERDKYILNLEEQCRNQDRNPSLTAAVQ